ncbi:hypothetical protein DSECCO2_378050 [anaerobic digester metagenome]
MSQGPRYESGPGTSALCIQAMKSRETLGSDSYPPSLTCAVVVKPNAGFRYTQMSLFGAPYGSSWRYSPQATVTPVRSA